jgi:hypothetical protein
MKGDFNVAYGNYNNTQAGGAINVPVTDNLAIRAAVNYDHRDSFLKAGQPVGPEPLAFQGQYSRAACRRC